MTVSAPHSPHKRPSEVVSQRRKQQGMSLIELMVSMTIGLIIVAAMGYIFLGSTQVFRSLEATSRIQENIRYAFERLSHDVRMAGNAGCASSTTVNVLNDPTAWTSNLFGRPVSGYSAGSTLPSDISGVSAGDVLVLVQADNETEYIVDTHNPPSAQFQLTANHDLKQGEILVVTDCRHAAVFQMTNVNNNNSIQTVNHNTGNSTSPGNCTKGFGLPLMCGNPNGTEYVFPAGSRLFRLAGVAYYIGLNSKGENALYRQRLTQQEGTASTEAEELIDGIENMKIEYGIDTSATEDGAVDTYAPASQVGTIAPGADDDAKWKRVLAVRITLLAASKPGQNLTLQPQPVKFGGATITPTDRRLRKSFTTTIAVRNRL